MRSEHKITSNFPTLALVVVAVFCSFVVVFVVVKPDEGVGESGLEDMGLDSSAAESSLPLSMVMCWCCSNAASAVTASMVAVSSPQRRECTNTFSSSPWFRTTAFRAGSRAIFGKKEKQKGTRRGKITKQREGQIAKKTSVTNSEKDTAGEKARKKIYLTRQQQEREIKDGGLS
jgi:hypothetical protein